jgi:hemoglobin
VLGGPARYTEELGGYESLVAHRRGLAITPERRFRFASLLSLAAADARLADDPEFRSALVAYVGLGNAARDAQLQPGADVIANAPVPR